MHLCLLFFSLFMLFYFNLYHTLLLLGSSGSFPDTYTWIERQLSQLKLRKEFAVFLGQFCSHACDKRWYWFIKKNPQSVLSASMQICSFLFLSTVYGFCLFTLVCKYTVYFCFYLCWCIINPFGLVVWNNALPAIIDKCIEILCF